MSAVSTFHGHNSVFFHTFSTFPPNRRGAEWAKACLVLSQTATDFKCNDKGISESVTFIGFIQHWWVYNTQHLVDINRKEMHSKLSILKLSSISNFRHVHNPRLTMRYIAIFSVHIYTWLHVICSAFIQCVVTLQYRREKRKWDCLTFFFSHPCLL